jgi:hypothetical protein
MLNLNKIGSCRREEMDSTEPLSEISILFVQKWLKNMKRTEDRTQSILNLKESQENLQKSN